MTENTNDTPDAGPLVPWAQVLADGLSQPAPRLTPSEVQAYGLALEVEGNTSALAWCGGARGLAEGVADCLRCEAFRPELSEEAARAAAVTALKSACAEVLSRPWLREVFGPRPSFSGDRERHELREVVSLAYQLLLYPQLSAVESLGMVREILMADTTRRYARRDVDGCDLLLMGRASDRLRDRALQEHAPHLARIYEDVRAQLHAAGLPFDLLEAWHRAA